MAVFTVVHRITSLSPRVLAVELVDKVSRLTVADGLNINTHKKVIV